MSLLSTLRSFISTLMQIPSDPAGFLLRSHATLKPAPAGLVPFDHEDYQPGQFLHRRGSSFRLFSRTCPIPPLCTEHLNDQQLELLQENALNYLYSPDYAISNDEQFFTTLLQQTPANIMPILWKQCVLCYYIAHMSYYQQWQFPKCVFSVISLAALTYRCPRSFADFYQNSHASGCCQTPANVLLHAFRQQANQKKESPTSYYDLVRRSEHTQAAYENSYNFVNTPSPMK